MPNWTGGISSTSDEDDDEQQTVSIGNTHLRKCLLCNIEVKIKVEKINESNVNFSLATSKKSSL